jgi:N utilization substance protein B
MGTRRAGRELALQALYQLDVAGDDEAERDLGLFWSHFAPGGEVREFARQLVEGVRAQRLRIDALIAETARHWRLPRFSRVDLSLLRLATFELSTSPDVPASVTINEAVEIARHFGSEDSAAFVNGVLDAIATTLGVKGEGKRRDPAGERD